MHTAALIFPELHKTDSRLTRLYMDPKDQQPRVMLQYLQCHTITYMRLDMAMGM